MSYEIIARNNKEKYKVSAIVPVYNVEEYLKETIFSLVSQTLDEVEIILVDDGSTDNSEEIIRTFLEQYESIVYIKQENAGPGEARNVGIELARGEFISFVDSDDLLPVDALESMYEAALKEGADVVTGASLSFNSKRSWYIASHVDKGVYKPGPKTLVRNPELLYSLGPCNKMFRTTMIKSIRFPHHIKVTEDHPFVIEAYLKAKKIFTVDKVIYNYRRRETEDNVSLSQNVHVDSLNVLRDIMKSLKMSDDLWGQYLFNPYAEIGTKAFYLNRIVWADIWPALNQSIRTKDGSVQFQTLQILNQWIEGFTPELFNRVTGLHHIFTYELVLRFAMLDKKVYPLYLSTISLCFKLMNPGSAHTMSLTRFVKEVRAVKKAYQKQSLFPLKSYVFRARVKKAWMLGQKIVRNGTVRRILYPLFRLLPVQKKIIFASNKLTNLGDSYKYIYDEIKRLRPGYEVKGYFNKTRNFSEFCKYFYDMATAKYIILDDYYRPFYNLTFRKDTEIIQIWHAAGAFKKFGYSAIGSEDSNTEEFERRAHSFYTKAVVTSQEIVPKYADAFKIPEKNVFPLGLARTDLFFDEEKLQYIKERYLGAYPQMRGKKIITYAPTFRGGPKDRAAFTLQLDMERMASELGDDYLLILKLHPSVTKQSVIPNELKQFVLNLSRDDMNDVLAITDILISDYSSLIFEYALLQRPMLFFAYDLEQYIGERGFYYDYESFVPGPIIGTTEGLIEAIRTDQFDFSKIEAFRSKFFNDLDGRSAQRFVETMIEP